MSIKSILWCEAYRPDNLKAMILSKKHRMKFKEYISEKDIPHLLFFGPPGGGKTTLANIIIKKLNAVSLNLNASSKDRGIATVKGRIKEFAQSSTVDKRLKIVFIDEADGMLYEAQNALKNTIETYSSSCRFILTANNIEKISPALKSRCTQFKFDSFKKSKVLAYITDILEDQKVVYKIKSIQEVIETFYPDIRTIVNTIQMCCSKNKDGQYKFKLDKQALAPFDLDELETILLSGNIKPIRNLIKDVVDFGPIFEWLFNTFIFKSNEDDETKSEMAITVSYYITSDIQSLHKEINFVACCIELHKILKIKTRF